MQQTRARLLECVREVVGRPRMVSISLVHDDHAEPGSRPFTWVQDRALGGGRLQGYGVHDLDLLLEAFGDVEEVAAATEVGVKQREAKDGTTHEVTAEDAYAILIRFAGGGLAQISLTATARHKRGDVLEFHGDGGSVRLDADKVLHWGAPASSCAARARSRRARRTPSARSRATSTPRSATARRPTRRCRRGCACRRCSTRSTSPTTSAAGSRPSRSTRATTDGEHAVPRPPRADGELQAARILRALGRRADR